MSSAWDKTAEAAKKAGTGGKFVSLKDDGDKVVGVFVGDPEPSEVVWIEKEKKYVPFDAEKHAGEKPSLRAKINFFTIKEGKGGAKELTPVNKMQILEMGVMLVKDVLKVRDKYGLDKWAFEIERHGAKGNTKTTYSVLPDEKIPSIDGLEEKLKEAKRHDLTSDDDEDEWEGDDKGGKKAEDKKADKKPEEKKAEAKKDDDGPIGPKEFEEIAPRLKALPKETLAEFTAHFKLGKVKELKKSQLKAADEWIGEREAAAKKASEPKEEDPFAD